VVAPAPQADHRLQIYYPSGIKGSFAEVSFRMLLLFWGLFRWCRALRALNNRLRQASGLREGRQYNCPDKYVPKCNLGTRGDICDPSGVGFIFGHKPVVAPATRAYHRLRLWYPSGIKRQSSRLSARNLISASASGA